MIVNQYTQNDWIDMKNMKKSIEMMIADNSDGSFDVAIKKYRKALKMFFTDPEWRKELPDEEETAALAA